MKFGSLFAGIGGFDLGFERSGWECAWQVEVDDFCNDVLQKHWPSVSRYRDIKDVKGDELEPVDLICGGFPCQDISVAGRGEGLAGGRSGLWFEFARILEEARPARVVIENVGGLLSSPKGANGRDLAIILRGLADLGYMGAYRLLDAQYFGVAQRRKRVFIVGYLGSGGAVEVLLQPESVLGNAPARSTSGTAVARPLTARSGGAGKESQDNQVVAGTLGDPRRQDFEGNGAFVFEPRFARNGRGAPDEVVPPLKAQSGTSGKGDGAPLVYDARGLGDGDTVNTLVGDHMDRPTDYTPVVFRKAQKAHSPEDDERWEEADQAPTLDASGHGARTATAVTFHGQQDPISEKDASLPIESQHRGSVGVYWDGGDVSDTLDRSQIGKQQAMPGKRRLPAVLQNGVRRLTPLECERLMGFPDNWTAGHSDSRRYKMIGNAVVVNVAEWIAMRMQEVDDAGG